MSILLKLVIANLFCLVLPLIVYTIVVYTHAFDNVIIGFIYLAHIVLPFLFILGFREDSIRLGCPSRKVFGHTIAACITWAIVVGMEATYRHFVNNKIIPLLATKLYGEAVLPSMVPKMNYLIPLYNPMFIGFMFFYCTIFLTVAVVISHCKPIK